jgi:hypothetical protein
MKNTIKMSLVAALAVAGLSTTASAAGLEEAIKGVNISGKMEVEYDYTSEKEDNADKETANQWDIDWDITAKVPVNDNITAVFGAQGDHAEDITVAEDAVQDPITVTKTYFQYSNGPVTAMAGKMGMAGAPWFDDERGNGLVALYNAGPVTLAAAHFTNSNANVLSSDVADTAVDAFAGIDTDTSVTLEDAHISALAAIGSMGPVNASVWYAQVSGISADVTNATTGAGILSALIDADSYSVNLNGTFDIVNVDVRYTDTDYDSETDLVDGDASLLKIVASADLGVATPYVGYGQTDNEQHVAGVDLTSDTDSAVDFGGEILSIDELADAKAWIIGVKAPVGNFALEAFYIDGDADEDIDYNEFYFGADYKMSKNFTIGSHYAVAEVDVDGDDTDYVNAAISLEYKF